MSVPADKLMELMRGPRSAGGGAPSGIGMPGMAPGEAPSDAETPPTASPMSTPEPKMGSKEAAMIDRKSTRLNSSHVKRSRMPSSA